MSRRELRPLLREGIYLSFLSPPPSPRLPLPLLFLLLSSCVSFLSFIMKGAACNLTQASLCENPTICTPVDSQLQIGKCVDCFLGPIGSYCTNLNCNSYVCSILSSPLLSSPTPTHSHSYFFFFFLFFFFFFFVDLLVYFNSLYIVVYIFLILFLV